MRIGFAENAAPGRDAYDQLAPPGDFEAASLRLVNDAFTSSRSDLASEFRPEGQAGAVFDLVLTAPSPTPLSLRVDGLASFAEAEVRLIDEAEARSYNLHDYVAQALPVMPGRYRLAIGSPAFVQDVEHELVPERPVLHANYPNPFNPNTHIAYAVPTMVEGEVVRLAVYNVLGQRVRMLVEGAQKPGFYEVDWDGTDEAGRQVASGVYLYRLQVGRFRDVRSMLLVK